MHNVNGHYRKTADSTKENVFDLITGKVFLVSLTVCLCCWSESGTHQDRILHVVSQQPRVVQCVLGFLHLGVHRSLLHLVLQGPKEFVQRLSSRVLKWDPHRGLSDKFFHALHVQNAQAWVKRVEQKGSQLDSSAGFSLKDNISTYILQFLVKMLK